MYTQLETERQQVTVEEEFIVTYVYTMISDISWQPLCMPSFMSQNEVLLQDEGKSAQRQACEGIEGMP